MLLLTKDLSPIPTIMVHNEDTCEQDSNLYYSSEECMWIRQWAEEQTPQFATVGSGHTYEVNRSVRDVYLYGMPRTDLTDGLYHKILYQVHYANTNAFNFDIAGIYHDLQVLKYTDQTQQHYNWHIDISGGPAYGRKISYIIQLSDESEYEGGDLEVFDGTSTIAPKKQGSVIMFPSYVCHRVSPVTRGTRWSLVIWIQGTSHFR